MLLLINHQTFKHPKSIVDNIFTKTSCLLGTNGCNVTTTIKESQPILSDATC